MNAPVSHAHLRTPWQVLLDGPSGDLRAYHAAWMGTLVQGFAGQVTEAVLVLPAGGDSGSGEAPSYRPAAFWPDGAACSPALADACEQALGMRMVVSRSALAGSQSGSLMAVPVVVHGQTSAVVALSFRMAQVPRNAQEWVRWGAGWLDMRVHADGQGNGLQERLLAALDLTVAVMAQQGAIAAANAFVNEAAVRLGCDRVSLGFGRSHGIRLEALSNSADFSRHLDLARAIEAAMDEACDQGSSISVGEGKLLEAGPQGTDAPSVAAMVVTKAHTHLSQVFGTRLVLTVPFLMDKHQYGAVCFEWAQSDVDEAHLQVALGLPAVVGRLLLEKRRSQRIWPVRLKDSLLDTLGVVLGPRYALRKLSLIAAVGLTAWLAGAVGTHRVSAKAALEGGVRRVVVAPFDGYVATAHARAGEVVKSGQALATLDDRDMRLEVDKWQSQQTQYARQMQDAHAQRNLAQVQIAMAQARQAAAQRRLSESMLSKTRVDAPFAGVIVAGDLSQSLGAAIKKGQTLFEIAPLDSYRIVLEVDEADVGYVAAGQRGDLMVSALPGQTFPFTVKLVTPVAHANEGHNLFRVEATLDGMADRLRPGMEGIGKVVIGERNQFWIWTHRLSDWLRLQAWNWFGL